jgi:hypothetical protein
MPAIGNVPNLAARLCGEARAGEILLDAQVEHEIAALFYTEPVGPLKLRGFFQPVPAVQAQSAEVIAEVAGDGPRFALVPFQAERLLVPLVGLDVELEVVVEVFVVHARICKAVPLHRLGGDRAPGGLPAIWRDMT